MHKIILIDDNAWEQVAARLRGAFALSGLDLTVFSSADQLLPLLPADSHACPADLFVIDVMMPPGDAYREAETHDGLITGLFLARDIRDRFPLVPIILWSGTSLQTVRALATHMEKRLTKCLFIKKPFSGDKLISLVNGYFANGRFTKSWVAQIWDGIVLRPSIGGVGIDVKQILDKRTKDS